MDEQRTAESTLQDENSRIRDEALFKSIEKKKKKKRRRIIRTVIIVILILAAAGVGGVFYLRRKVAISFASSVGDVVTYDATTGSISTTVSGSGTLSNVGEETISIPEGIEIEEVKVSANGRVKKGDVIAGLDMATVMQAMSSVQSSLDSLDKEITSAAKETVNSAVIAGVTGRVKKIYAEPGMSVIDCMYDHGALALLSLDGYMAVDVKAGELSAGDSVTVQRGEGTGAELEGTVSTVTAGTACILVTDNGPELGEHVSVLSESGKVIGTGELYIHSQLKVTGISGTVNYVNAKENDRLHATSTVVTLKDTLFSANYEALLKQRREKEEDLLTIMQLNRDGALLAPYDGSVSAVLYDEETAAEASASGTTGTDTDVITISPDRTMEISISVDEANILSLEVGQTAQITVNSIGDDVFEGRVTEINKTATSSSGVTRYSAVIELDKNERMLPGMSAKVIVRIQGVDNAIIIPAEALHQTSSRSFVYTSYDDELKQFGGLTEVETGISNSSYVEIISGLKEGDTVYYTETQQSMFATMGGFPGGGGNGNFPGGSGSGSFPGGGNSGGFPGGSGSGSFPGGGNSGGFPGGGGSGGFPGGRG